MDLVADVDGDARAFVAALGLDPDEPHALSVLCEAATGYPPVLLRQPQDGRLAAGRVVLRVGLEEARRGHAIGHELGHVHYEARGYSSDDLEERCDLFGAALVAPRRAYQRAIGVVGHSVSTLAQAFHTTQACALLRVGEVTGRPVALLVPRLRLRGDWAAWPAPPEAVHPVRLSDSGRWGLMAR